MSRTNEGAGVERRRSSRMRRAAAALLVAAAVAGCDGSVGEKPEGPSVLLISIDTLRADALGSYGQPLDVSPHIDRLAREGVRFDQCATASPSTLPSHATIFTGQYPPGHGVRANAGYVLPARSLTLAERLRENGYRTAAEVAAGVLGRRTQIHQGFERFRGVYAADAQRRVFEGEERTVTQAERPAEDVTRHALAFLEAHATDRFFLWLHYFDPHSFYLPPEPFASRFPESPYHGEVAYADEQVGRVLAAIDRLGLRERTLVVLTSDHGEGLGEHGETSHSFFVYDTTVRVPLILRGPGLPAGREVAAPVRTVDIAPTVLDLLGLPPLPDAEGASLRPLLRGDPDAVARVAYGESIEPLTMFGSSPLRFVREGDWKYIHKLDPELYDLRSDPRETRNLAAQRSDRVEQLRGRLRELLNRAPVPDAAAPLDADTWAQLHALGYAPANAPAGLDDRALEPHGPDPAALRRELGFFGQAWGAYHAGRFEVAAAMFRELRERHPDSAPTLFGLIHALQRAGRRAEAAPLLERAIELDPRFFAFYVQLAELRAEGGDPEAAEQLLRAALAVEACTVAPRVRLSQLLHASGRHAEQLALLEAGVSQCPDSPDLRNDYAWALATSPVDALRDGARALQLAREAVEATDRRRPDLLDTLAAAHAEVGDFAGAERAAREALTLVEGRGAPPEVVAIFRGHLEAFQEHRPLRE